MEMRKLLFLPAALGLAVLWGATAAAADTRIVKTFDKWRVTCVETEQTKGKQCVIVYALTDRKRQLVFSWSMGRAQDGKRIAAVRTPTGVLLTSGVKIGFPDTNPVTVAYKTCGPQLCLAEFEFTDLWLQSFTTRPTLEVGYEAVDGSPLTHEVPLENFKEGYAFLAAQLGD